MKTKHWYGRIGWGEIRSWELLRLATLLILEDSRVSSCHSMTSKMHTIAFIKTIQK